MTPAERTAMHQTTIGSLSFAAFQYGFLIVFAHAANSLRPSSPKRTIRQRFRNQRLYTKAIDPQ
jgi:hypothetical protein